MKKNIIILAALLVGGLQTITAQDEKHEISVGVGFGTISDISTTIVDELFNPREGQELGEAGNTPGFSAEYFYKTGRIVRVGAALAYSQSSKNIFRRLNGAQSNIKLGEMKYRFFTVMPAVKFQWVDTKSFGFYSKLAAGVTVINQKEDITTKDAAGVEKTSDTDTVFNLQVSLVGLEVGSPQWRGFCELGFGEQGILFLGLRHRF